MEEVDSALYKPMHTAALIPQLAMSSNNTIHPIFCFILLSSALSFTCRPPLTSLDRLKG